MEQINLFYLCVCLLFIGVFGEASTAKLREGGAPQWFLDQFEGTWIAKFPLGAQYRLIMVLELAVTLLFVGALVSGEPFAPDQTLMGYGLLLASGVFSMLCFGQRVSFDFAGAASSFCYSGITLLIWFAVAASHEHALSL